MGHNPREVADAPKRSPSLDDLLGAATSREPWFPDDTKSGARFERLVIDGERFVLKYQDATDDWLMRATGDTGERYVRLWESGLLDRLPAVIDHAVVATAFGDGVGRILHRDVAGSSSPPGAPIDRRPARRFLDHMAALHAAFWGWHGRVGSHPRRRPLPGLISPATRGPRRPPGRRAVVPLVLAEGWAALAAAPRRSRGGRWPRADPGPLLAALADPATLVHGDWKAGNLGTDAAGAPCCSTGGRRAGTPLRRPGLVPRDQRRLLPESKDAASTGLRAALEDHGIDTAAGGTTRWPSAARRHGAVRVGEGARRTGDELDLVGAARPRRRPPVVTTAYDDAVAAEWQAGAGLVYDPLGAALVATCEKELAGRRVLDVGSGVGAVATLVAAAGGAVVASDLSPSMIAAQAGRSWPAAVADVVALPFRVRAPSTWRSPPS